MQPEGEGTLIKNMIYLARWTLLSLVIGAASGFVGGSFGLGVAWTSGIFQAHHGMLFLLPASGLLILLLYHVLGEDNNRGTNAMLEAVAGENNVRPGIVPAIYFGSLLTHIAGGSAGREGAALQMGGGLGTMFGRIFRLNEGDMKIAVMCGMAGVFSALFGTPMAAALFAMEIVSVGMIYYSALVPCVFSAFFARYISIRMHLAPTVFTMGEVPAFSEPNAVLTVALGLSSAVVAILFCMLLTETAGFYDRTLKNKTVRILTGAILVIVLTLLDGSYRYNNTGANLIVSALKGEALPWDFFLKSIFTALTLEAGFKGGEIVPAFSVGACFGCVFANVLGLPAGLCAACGMLAVFAGVTNCPLTALLIGFEMFCYSAMPYFVIVIAVSFTFSGYFSLYSSQSADFGKTKAVRINRKMRNITFSAYLQRWKAKREHKKGEN